VRQRCREQVRVIASLIAALGTRGNDEVLYMSISIFVFMPYTWLYLTETKHKK
jgi:hypothetical protein